MTKEELLKSTKDQLADMVLELLNTEAGQAFATAKELQEKLTESEAKFQAAMAVKETADADVRKLQEKLDQSEAAYQAAVAAKATVDAEVEALRAKASSADTEELQRQVDDLLARNAALESTKGDKRPVVKVKGKNCLLVAGRVRLRNGDKVTAEQLLNMPEELEYLLESGSSLLKVLN